MTFNKIICFVAVALMTTATSYAQHAGSGYASGTTGQACASGDCGQGSGTHAGCRGCGGFACKYFGCDHHPKYPSDSCCCRPWTYDDASALWANYCHAPIREHGCKGCCGGCKQPCCPSIVAGATTKAAWTWELIGINERTPSTKSTGSKAQAASDLPALSAIQSIRN